VTDTLAKSAILILERLCKSLGIDELAEGVGDGASGWLEGGTVGGGFEAEVGLGDGVAVSGAAITGKLSVKDNREK
jgi:hypothetical protein